MISVLTRLED